MDYTEKLITILQSVNDWLKFAEAKNAVLLAFCGAGITAAITYLSTAPIMLNSLRVGLLIALIFLCISSLICSLSFLPKTDIDHFIWLQGRPNRKSKNQQSDNDNFYFYNSLKKYEAEALLKALDRLYFSGKLQKPYEKELLDLSSQITVNSEIASNKFSFFRFALWFLIISIISVPISLLLSLLIYRTL